CQALWFPLYQDKLDRALPAAEFRDLEGRVPKFSCWQRSVFMLWGVFWRCLGKAMDCVRPQCDGAFTQSQTSCFFMPQIIYQTRSDEAGHLEAGQRNRT
ncbi:hypothetical protein QQF64_034528, partial [Cirrhinus molitorella]